MKLLIVAVCTCLLTACAATSNGAKPDYRHATVEVINVAQTQTQ